MLNVKQGSCEYQLLKSFDLTRPGSQTQVYYEANALTTTPLPRVLIAGTVHKKTTLFKNC